jgi:hypothetical protein
MTVHQARSSKEIGSHTEGVSMKFAILLTMKRVGFGCFCAGTLAAVACADGRGVPTSPSPSSPLPSLAATAPGNEATVRQPVDPSLSASSARSGSFHVTKECSTYTRQRGDYCTVTSSDLKAIEVGSRFVYAQAASTTRLDSDIVLDTPGHGNNTALGHCALDLVTGLGLCTFSGGTGKFTWFNATATVSCLDGPNCAVEGTYSFSPHD